MKKNAASGIVLGGSAVSAQIFFKHPAGKGGGDRRTHVERKPAVTEAVRRAVVERIGATNPAGARQFDAASKQHDLIRLFADDASRNGLDANDIADVAALYWLTAWSVVHRASPTDQETAAVRRQVHASLADAKELLDASDEEKQQMADDMIFQLMLLQAAFQQARTSNDEQALDSLAQSTYQTALHNQVDLRAMKLEDGGLVGSA